MCMILDIRYIAAFNSSNIQDQIPTIEACIRDNKRWVIVNFLKSNDDNDNQKQVPFKCNIRKMPSIS